MGPIRKNKNKNKKYIYNIQNINKKLNRKKIYI